MPHVGRSAELRDLDEAAENDGPNQSGLLIVSGPPGVGKTALVTTWAHRAADRFPDGHLFLDLRGYAEGKPLSPATGLARVLRSLGVPAEMIPADEDEAAATFRSWVFGRRMLIVLDNARSASQVRPFLPGGTGPLVVVTSRTRLNGLVASNGARLLALGRLNTADAVELVQSVLGDRATEAPAAADRLCASCDHWPLALRIATARLAGDPAASLDAFADELNQRGPIRTLTVSGDENLSVRAAFDLSYQHLPARVQRLFRLLGSLDGMEFSVDSAAAVGGTDVDVARRDLEALTASHLIEPAESGRFQLHDLIRTYARDLSEIDDTDSEIDLASRRLLEWYVSTAIAGDRLLLPDRPRRPRPNASPLAAPFRTREEAVRWYERERANFLPLVREAVRRKAAELVCELLATTVLFYFERKYWTEFVEQVELALACAEEVDHGPGSARMLTALGIAQVDRQEYESALEYLDRAARIWEAPRDRWEVGIALTMRGIALCETSRVEDAISALGDATAIWRAAGGAWEKSLTSHQLGIAYHRVGNADRAQRYYEQSLRQRRTCADRYGEAWVLHDLASLRLDQGDHRDAELRCREALAIRTEIGDRRGQGSVRCSLGQIARATGDLDAAREHFHGALSVFDPNDATWIHRVTAELTSLDSG